MSDFLAQTTHFLGGLQTNCLNLILMSDLFTLLSNCIVTGPQSRSCAHDIIVWSVIGCIYTEAWKVTTVDSSFNLT